MGCRRPRGSRYLIMKDLGAKKVFGPSVRFRSAGEVTSSIEETEAAVKEAEKASGEARGQCGFHAALVLGLRFRVQGEA